MYVECMYVWMDGYMCVCMYECIYLHVCTCMYNYMYTLGLGDIKNIFYNYCLKLTCSYSILQYNII